MRPRYAIPLIVVTVLAVYGLLATLEEETKERIDPYMLLFIGGTFTACMVVTLIYTHSWTLRSAGVLLTLAGDAVLYSLGGSGQFVTLSPAVMRYEVDFIRACFLVGGPLLLLGLGAWIWRVRRPPPEPLELDQSVRHDSMP